MKVMCQKCGCHFKEEFKKSLKCGFWERKGAKALSLKNKKIVWEWMFSLPQDQIAGEDGVALVFEWWGEDYFGNEFAKQIPDYDKWSENKRKKFQEDWFKFLENLSEKDKKRILLAFFRKINET